MELEFRDWLDLSPAVTVIILTKVGETDVLSHVRCVCSFWRSLCKYIPDKFSITICIEAWDPSGIKNLNKRLQAKETVDQSDKMMEICVENYCNDDDHDDVNKYLSYMLRECSCSLKRLRIQSYYRVSGDKFINIAEQLPALEQVELSWIGSFKKAVKEIGLSCPRLKYFGVQGGCSLDSDKDITLNMPQLRYLRLSSISISNIGLQTILDKCSHLQYLNLHNCTGLDLTKDFLDMCNSKIKVFLVS